MAIALGTLAMLLGNVGLQVFNNWCNNRQNDELQRKREEFERAAREHQTDRMWKILREGQALTLELEKAKQEQRIEELESEMGQLLQTLAYQATIENWPLGVLPIVMKNQALGNLLAHQEESFALHCIFTPSNYTTFNKCVFPRIEQALEEYCNKYWSPASTHPLLFYSGAWKSSNAPSGTQTNSMRSALSNLPTLMITPFFRPTDGKLVFQIQMWGVGASSTDQFYVPEIEPKSDEFHFQRTYTNKLDYEKDTALLDEVVEDLVPYLQCLIGFMADTYFWSSAGLKPQLPHLVTNGTINTDGMKYLVNDSREYYNKLLLTGEERAKENPFAQDNLLNLYEGSAELWDEETKKSLLESIIFSYNCRILGECPITFVEALFNKDYHIRDLPFLVRLGKHGSILAPKTNKMLNDEIDRLNRQEPKFYPRDSFPYDLLSVQYEQELDFENVLHLFIAYCDEMKLDNVSILISCINQNEYHFNTYDDEKDVILYYDEPFNYCYIVESVKRQRNINSLFPYGRTKQISCRSHRVGYLIEKINSSDLIY